MKDVHEDLEIEEDLEDLTEPDSGSKDHEDEDPEQPNLGQKNGQNFPHIMCKLPLLEINIKFKYIQETSHEYLVEEDDKKKETGEEGL